MAISRRTRPVSTPGRRSPAVPPAVSSVATTATAAVMLVAQLPLNVQAAAAYSGRLQNCLTCILAGRSSRPGCWPAVGSGGSAFGSGSLPISMVRTNSAASPAPDPNGIQRYWYELTRRCTVTVICTGATVATAGVTTTAAVTGGEASSLHGPKVSWTAVSGAGAAGASAPQFTAG